MRNVSKWTVDKRVVFAEDKTRSDGCSRLVVSGDVRVLNRSLLSLASEVTQRTLGANIAKLVVAGGQAKSTKGGNLQKNKMISCDKQRSNKSSSW